MSARTASHVIINEQQPDQLLLLRSGCFIIWNIPKNPGDVRANIKKRKEGEPYKVVVIACANRLVHHVYAILSKG